MNEERWITKADFARERDVSAGRVSQWLTDGRITEGAKNGEHPGLIEAVSAHAALDEMLDQSKGVRDGGLNVTSRSPDPVTSASAGAAAAGDAAPAAPQSNGAQQSPAAADRPAGSQQQQQQPQQPEPRSGYWGDKERRERADANMAELKYQQAAGGLVSVEGVRKEQAALARALRNKLQAMIDRVAPLVDPANPDRAYKILTDEWHAIARELRIEVQQRADAQRELEAA